MKLPAILAALTAATLISQEMPEPKHKEHDALKLLSGNWEFVMKMEAMPGVPGMEQATESKGTERAELVCNGLWLKSTIDSTWKGAPFQGLWLAGYDPFAKKYKLFWVSSSAEEEECGLAPMDGTYDEKTKTWTWTGDSPQGQMRTTFVLKDNDNSVETSFLKKDGKETKCMEITRKRARSPAAVDASIKAPPKVSKEHDVLHKDVGEWEATVVMAAEPGKEPAAESATERVIPICNGRWLWTDFKGQLMGSPFEGHALYGYDPKQKKYVSLWIDSMSPVAALTSGTYDPAKQSFTLTGDSVDPAGKPMAIKEVLTAKDDNTRLLKMEFKCPEQTSNMEITYKRKNKG